MTDPALAAFGTAYARHRAEEGRAYSAEQLLELPYLRRGPLAHQWSVRARSFDAFVRHALRPLAARHARPLVVLDLGAGNGWLAYRATLEGHRAIALDIREDAVDGLGAAALFEQLSGGRMTRVTASFAAIPMTDASIDLAVFNASLHYTTNLPAILAEAVRVVRSDGLIAILDSPFYPRDSDGLAMVVEKQAQAAERFGGNADALMSLPFIEYLTSARLAAASRPLALEWQRHRVIYPLWYELRPLVALLCGRRPPSRFDLWTARRP